MVHVLLLFGSDLCVVCNHNHACPFRKVKNQTEWENKNKNQIKSTASEYIFIKYTRIKIHWAVAPWGYKIITTFFFSYCFNCVLEQFWNLLHFKNKIQSAIFGGILIEKCTLYTNTEIQPTTCTTPNCQLIEFCHKQNGQLRNLCIVYVCVYVLIVYGRPVNRTKWTVHDIRKKISNDRHDHMVSLNSFVIFLGGPIYI